MRRLCLLVASALLFCAGCATEAQKRQWDEAWKDARGDNMQMRGFGQSASKPAE